ncbi:peptidoglycan-binding domain-containing protein [Paraliomyxa miuraensis]|uniref:peptidoglycan-binding domain-containing protein n=1 Tax=Paraliomyxa miuraensis TaxID=376150 RepID=UPI00225C3CC1|nr:peptidoglycan-binding protein [Paraliomyxa miuraensis]MCX4244284.1 peptidoglycan-binding protein [Paraliomyxa miuraensis]
MRTDISLRSLTVSLCLALTATFGCDAEDGRDGEELEEFEGAYDGTQPLGKADGVSAPRYAWPLTRFGDQGQDVFAAQYLLQEHGQELEVNGDFDTMTELATVAFQASKGLDDDGLIGNFTWEAMVLTVRPGDQDRWAVRGVQDLLKNRYGRAVEIDGNVNDVTEQAIRAFQEEHCLTVDGIVGMQTWNSLVADVDSCSNAGRLLQLHNEGKIQLLSTDFGRNDGADPLANITDAAGGQESNRSCNFPGGGRDSRLPCGTVMLDAQLIDAMISLHDEYGFSYVVTAISGARHSTNSYHYRGRAVDIGVVNGAVIRGSTSTTRAMVDACRAMGAVEALGPHNDSHHQDHIHCAF